MEDLHGEDPESLVPFRIGEDQNTRWHRAFYAGFSGIEELFLDLVRHTVDNLGWSGGVVYQRVPNFRVHYPGNMNSSRWHRDTDFSHCPAEWNAFVPLTCARDTAAIQILGAPPIEGVPGDVVVWDGANVLHGNAINATGKTRVSLDFRVCRESEFVSSEGESVCTGLKMRVGSYYAVL